MAESTSTPRLGRRERASRDSRLAREERASSDAKRICSLYQDGLSVEAAGRGAGRSPFFAWNALKVAGFTLRRTGNPDKVRPYRQAPPETLEVAVQRYVAGESAKSLGDCTGISKITLLRELRRRGIHIRLQAQGEPSEIVASYLAGLSMKMCGDLYGCTKRRVAACLKSAGIPVRVRRKGACPENAKRLGDERRLIIQRATPRWADRKAIRAVYAEVARLTKETGAVYEVDHIIPLKSRRVCGLHVAWNLQPLLQIHNRRKKNRLIPDEMSGVVMASWDHAPSPSDNDGPL